MIIRPLTTGVVDWKGWNALRSEHGEAAATANLDKMHVKQGDPHSLIACLHDTQNQSLRDNIVEELWLCDVGFLILTDDRKLLAELQSHTKVPIVWSMLYRDGEIEAILKANLAEIKWYVSRLCQMNVSRQAREVGNQIHGFMCQAGCKDLWINYKKLNQKDDTYVLQC